MLLFFVLFFFYFNQRFVLKVAYTSVYKYICVLPLLFTWNTLYTLVRDGEEFRGAQRRSLANLTRLHDSQLIARAVRSGAIDSGFLWPALARRAASAATAGALFIVKILNVGQEDGRSSSN